MQEKLENFLIKIELPVLVLAGFSIILYILDLFHVIPESLLVLNLFMFLIIDLIFLIDLMLKIYIKRMTYIKSPWFLIDLLSTLPIINSFLAIIGFMTPSIRTIQVVRSVRIARVTRIMQLSRFSRAASIVRIAKTIRTERGLTFLRSKPEDIKKTPNFNRAILISIPVLLISYMTAIYTIQYLLRPSTVLVDQIQGIILIILLITVGFSVFISKSLSIDQNKRREQSLLKKCFSPAIVDRFYTSPESIERYYKRWATVFFIDIKGFTKTIEKYSKDIEGLAIVLKEVMDIACKEIISFNGGIVDKFLGDAVMGWIGGHFSKQWELVEEYRKKLCLDEIELLDQDIASVLRTINEKSEQEYLLSISENPDEKVLIKIQNEINELNNILTEAGEKEDILFEKQKLAIKEDPKLEKKHLKAVALYKKEVAKSVVECCISISEKVYNQHREDVFRDLKIGIASGDVMIGNFGSHDQVGYTVLGPTVNRAARLEPASAKYGCKILIDHNTHNLLKKDANFNFRNLPNIHLKGIKNDLNVFEPFLSKKSPNADFLDSFNNAVIAFEKGEYNEAKDFFEEADRKIEGHDDAAILWKKTSIEKAKG